MEDETSRTTNVIGSAPLALTESLDSTMEVQQHALTVKRKAIESRSAAWPHYEKLIEDGINKAKCRYCGKVLLADSTKNGTSGLNKHLKTCPKNPNKVNNFNSKYKQSNLNFPLEGEMCDGAIWTFDQEASRRALVEMLILDELPFRFVEKEGFKNFMKKTQPLFRVPSRRTVTRDCYQVFGEERQKFMKYLKETSPRVVTSHKGDEMARCISKCLLDCKLEKIITITVDNASSNDVMVKELHKQIVNWGSNMKCGNHLHVRCMAHILNLIVQDGLKEVGPSIKRVRQMVKYVRQSPARIRKFKECCELKNINSKKSLCLDVPTRWNSTYLMLDAAQHFESAFDYFDLEDGGLSTYLANHVCEDGSVAGVLESDDWQKVSNMVIFLKRFYDLTEKVSGSLYVTSAGHFEDIVELHNHLRECMEDNDPSLAKMGEKMKQKFVKYWGAPEKMNKVLFIASILDPRNKLEYVGDALEDMFGDEKGSEIKDEMVTYMKSMFEEYVAKFSNVSRRPSTLSDLSSQTSDSSISNTSTKSTKVRNRIQMKRNKLDGTGLGSKSELERYLSEELEPTDDDDNFDILSWWKVHSPRYKILSEMARDVLAIPISSVASECAFSTGGRILDSFRSSLTPKLVQAVICLQDWRRNESYPINVEEDFNDLMKLELAMDDIDLHCSS
ncbi:zinc finger BED domain-containing protein RICESLEEPER 1-like [Solanum dulcamara]|uniref:zinc finger BED domain-containing protein RICESLEEPER 1-like n=1 Tax=Solanum dulcamara TaxID=45834 RepID=UPI0024855608|nr:zinc finger BED domain-containing protein RICESLEEPER 1-like [Solanum dulcamara]